MNRRGWIEVCRALVVGDIYTPCFAQGTALELWREVPDNLRSVWNETQRLAAEAEGSGVRLWA